MPGKAGNFKEAGPETWPNGTFLMQVIRKIHSGAQTAADRAESD